MYETKKTEAVKLLGEDPGQKKESPSTTEDYRHKNCYQTALIERNDSAVKRPTSKEWKKANKRRIMKNLAYHLVFLYALPSYFCFPYERASLF